MNLVKPTPAIMAVSALISARREVRARRDGSQNTLTRAVSAVMSDLKGKELAAATLLVNIDNEKTSAYLKAIHAS